MSMRGYFRTPKTQQERKYNNTRRAKKLPTSWDDLKRTIQRSWKVHRKTPYRSVQG